MQQQMNAATNDYLTKGLYILRLKLLQIDLVKLLFRYIYAMT